MKNGVINSSHSGRFSGYWSYISGKKAKRIRLEGDIKDFEKELNWLKEETKEASSCWAKSSEAMLVKAEDALAEDNFNLGWSFLNTARGMAFLGSSSDNLKDYRKAKAEVIWHEANDKLHSWRKKTVVSLLLKCDEVKGEINGNDLFQAYEVLSTHFENEYHRIDEFERHLRLLIYVASIAIVLFIFLASTVPDIINISGWKYVLSIVLFGIMGAVASGMLSARGGTQARIPEQQISNSMTFAKLVVGAISALAIYVFIGSGLLKLELVGNPNSAAILAASFAAGFTERLVNRAVETVAQRDSSK